ncbi:wax ester/triacylglycerol synthase family O-acyltransferase [Aquabacterium humicola]|uniref:wax ester/triacylglycerol synthase family O-acyltransferase n=1 Tax=Aquabacterium humicola TaxID=3237377 RepID=UPI002543C756|nr:wax ester/triacylglycerol synthase family O-acyltransferase [Rubrivivax pictus]
MTTTPDEPMSPVDAAWYHMDGRVNPAIVTGVLVTRTPLDVARVQQVCRERLLSFERFRQRVVEHGLPLPVPHWRTLPDFDLDQHLHHVALPAPHDDEALRRLVGELASTPLDRRLPLWQWTLVDRVGRGSALVMRCHHCIGDGGAMMAVAQRLFDGAALPVHARHAAPPAPPRGLLGWLDGLAGGVTAIVGELLRPDDPASPMKGAFGVRQQVAWSRPLALKDVKRIGARRAAKVNDVLVATMTGALRAYLQRRGHDPRLRTLRAMVPVDLRPPARRGRLGNEFGLVILELPIGLARRDQRLAATQQRMDALKRSAEPFAMRVLMDLFGRGPKVLEDVANTLFGSKASVVFTNVAGPMEPVRFAGAPVERLMFCVPHPGNDLGMGISIMSYAGRVTLLVMADAGLVPDPQAITRLFEREFDALLRTASRPETRAPGRHTIRRRTGRPPATTAGRPRRRGRRAS